MPEHDRLHTLLKAFAYQKRDVTLASGERSNVYFDCKQVILSAEGHALCGALFLAKLEALEKDGAPFDGCGGMSIGADPLSSALSLTAWREQQRPLNAIYVRKEPKGHGTGQHLEGASQLKSGARLLLVEDVVTTGGSSLRAIEILRAGGFVVDTCVAILDRGAGGSQALKNAGVELHTFFTLADFPS